MKKSIEKEKDKTIKKEENKSYISNKNSNSKSSNKNEDKIKTKSINEETKHNVTIQTSSQETTIKNYKIEKAQFKSKGDINLYLQVYFC